MTLDFTGKVLFWRGPAPWYFVPLPATQSREVRDVARFVTYGWGVIPVVARIGETAWKTSLFPKDGRYLVPLKASVRAAEQLAEGDEVRVRLDIGADPVS